MSNNTRVSESHINLDETCITRHKVPSASFSEFYEQYGVSRKGWDGKTNQELQLGWTQWIGLIPRILLLGQTPHCEITTFRVVAVSGFGEMFADKSQEVGLVDCLYLLWDFHRGGWCGCGATELTWKAETEAERDVIGCGCHSRLALHGSESGVGVEVAGWIVWWEDEVVAKLDFN